MIAKKEIDKLSEMWRKRLDYTEKEIEDAVKSNDHHIIHEAHEDNLEALEAIYVLCKIEKLLFGANSSGYARV